MAAAFAVEANPSATAIEQSLAEFVLDKLDGPSKQLFAVSFAAQMSVDKHALVLDIADTLTWLGIDCIDSALRLLTRYFKEGDYKVVSILHPAAEDPKGGRPSKRYLISLDMFEDLLMLADTKQGRDARKMYKQLRDAVQDYTKMEMEKHAQIANERLAIGEGKLAELEAIQSKLQATIESQRRREEKKEARKKQQKQPLETAYLISNNPGGEGPFKCGMTEKEAKQRAKAMQTGNHEPVIVVAQIPCMNADLIEKVMHHIFYDYRTNDKLEWFDAPLCTMTSTLRFVVESIDGLNRVDHDEVDISEHLESVLAHMEGVIVPVKEIELEAVEEEIESELETVTESEALEALIEESETISSHSGTNSVCSFVQNPRHVHNMYALFCEKFVESSDLPQAHFTMIDAKMKWTEFGTWLMDNGYSLRRIPTPKESDFRNGLVAHLNVPCHRLKRLPLSVRTDTPKRSWFPGHILVDSCSDDI